MQYRKLGRTGIEASVLALGGSSLGGVFRPVEESEAIRCVHLALDHGINLIDTAPYYGATRAESVLGRALRGIPRGRYLLATKVGRYGPGIADFDFSPQRVERSVDESLARLGVDYVDFIQAHDIEFGELDKIIHETLPALLRVKAAGKARFVGVTGLPLQVFREVLDQVELDQIQSYCHYCLNDSSLAGLLPYLDAKGVAIFNSAPLAMRLLSDDGPPSWHPAPAVLRERCGMAAQYCRDHGTRLGKLALQYSLGAPGIHTHIVGTASPQRVLENIRDAEEPPDREILQAVLRILEPVHNMTWTSGGTDNVRIPS